MQSHALLVNATASHLGPWSQPNHRAIKKKDLIIVQHQYNNPSHEGGPQYVGPTLM
jgi:hypothetical protein